MLPVCLAPEKFLTIHGGKLFQKIFVHRMLQIQPTDANRLRVADMSSRLTFLFSVLATTALLFALYYWRLGQSPPYLHQDEAGFGLASFLLSTTGRDYYGSLLPVYVGYFENHQIGGAMIAYWAIPFIGVLGLSVTSLRASMATASLLSLGLFALLGWRLWENRWVSLTGVWILATSPLFFIQSRLFLELFLPIPFIVGWLIGVVEFERRGDERLLLLFSVILGLGFYSYGTARMIMPVYLGLTLVVYRLKGTCSWRTFAGAVVTYGLMMVPAVAFALQDPSLYMARFEGLSWLTGGPAPYSIVATYLHHFLACVDPSDLFIRGDSSLVHSTGRAGVYMLASLPFAAVGSVGLAARAVLKRDTLAILVLLAFLLFPAPLALLSETHAPARATYAVPIYALICVNGLVSVAEFCRRNHPARLVLAILMLVYVVEAGEFFADYFGGYPARAVARGVFNGNKPAAFRLLLQDAPTEGVYFDFEDTTSLTYAKLFSAEYGFKGSILPVTPSSGRDLPAGARVLTLRPKEFGASFKESAVAPEIVSGVPDYTILTKRGPAHQ